MGCDERIDGCSCGDGRGHQHERCADVAIELAWGPRVLRGPWKRDGSILGPRCSPRSVQCHSQKTAVEEERRCPAGVYPKATLNAAGNAVASFAWWRGFCSAPWRSCCRDHAGLAAGRCRGLNREGCARSGPFGSLPLRQSPKAPPLTRITMPRPMRTMGKRMCSQRSSTSAIGGRVATNFARATRTATSARKTMQ